MTEEADQELGAVAAALRQLVQTNLDGGSDAAVTAAAVTAYADARSAGLCHDGAWECALGAIDAARSTPISGAESAAA